MRLSRPLFLTALLALSPGVSAELFANAARGYAFEVSGHWKLAHPDFMLMSASGSSLSESELPPRGERSLIKISKNAGMIACIGADYEDTREQFELRGENWNGLVSVFVEPRRSNRPPRHVLQLVAQRGEDYRLFYLAVPTREWLSDRAASTRVLAALRFV